MQYYILYHTRRAVSGFKERASIESNVALKKALKSTPKSQAQAARASQYPIAQPSPRPSLPPARTPVSLFRVMTWARPKLARSWPFKGPLKRWPMAVSCAATAGEQRPSSSATTPPAVPSVMQKRGASTASWGLRPAATSLICWIKRCWKREFPIESRYER